MEILVHPITGSPKRCFPSPCGNFTLCNFTVKDGKIWRYAKNTIYLLLPKKHKKKKQKDENNLIKKKNEPVAKQNS
ncbi:MAG: hypothetical protein A3B83_04615 [Candidatus Magasanikbacteria bacterium RIFCSPHIGHO2_02_FULL_33_17]|nr:MAG: hypothetical protein A3B83_04615 [Candidatus Magasanikbacteria bacterium RIFCSPHIGHO2_02_FULL_33_17]